MIGFPAFVCYEVSIMPGKLEGYYSYTLRHDRLFSCRTGVHETSQITIGETIIFQCKPPFPWLHGQVYPPSIDRLVFTPSMSLYRMAASLELW